MNGSPLTIAAAIVDGTLAEVVREHVASGRWFIAMGQPGFNSPANNRHGYASKAGALAAIRRHAARGAAARAAVLHYVANCNATVTTAACGAGINTLTDRYTTATFNTTCAACRATWAPFGGAR